MNKQDFKKKFAEFHDKNYKKLLIIPAIILVFCVVYMGIFQSQNNDFIKKDVSLTGGTIVTINGDIDMVALSNAVSDKLESINIREVSDLFTNHRIAVIVETKSNEEITKNVLEDYLGYELNTENSSFEFTGSTLSDSFFRQLMIALIIAFILMSIVIFLQFKSFVPSMTIIFTTFADMFMALTVVNLLGMPISAAGIVAFLTIIGYGVDTNILLTTKAIKGTYGTLNRRLLESFKTGMTMTLIALFSVSIALAVVGSISPVLSQIFTIMIIGLSFDIINTWLTNVSIIKWYVLRRNKKHEN